MNAAGISPFLAKYIALWTSFCLVALLILAWDRKRLLREWREYWLFLWVPWKVCLFVPAFFFVTFAGRLGALGRRVDLSGVRGSPAGAVSGRRVGVAVVFQQLVLRWLSAVARWGVHRAMAWKSGAVAFHLYGCWVVVEPGG